MQAVSTSSSATNTINSDNEPNAHADSFRRSGGPPKLPRASTMPSLNVLIPSPEIDRPKAAQESKPTESPAFNASKPTEDAEPDGNISDRTSICRSPAWDDAERKARRKSKQEAKEKRRKEKQKSETEAKFSDKKKSRLKKAPPTNPKLDQLGPSMDKSVSEPRLSNVDASEAKSTKSIDTGRSRRGSLEIGFKALVNATQEMMTPWRSSQSSPSPGENGGSNESKGFVGGLKLQRAKEAMQGDDGLKRMSLHDDRPELTGGPEKRQTPGYMEDQSRGALSVPALYTGPDEFSKSVSGFSWIEGASVINQEVDAPSPVQCVTEQSFNDPEASTPILNPNLKRRHAKRFSTDRPLVSQATAARNSVYGKNDGASSTLSRRSSITPAIKGMKSAAKAAFVRHSHVPKSSSATIAHPNDDDPTGVQSMDNPHPANLGHRTASRNDSAGSLDLADHPAFRDRMGSVTTLQSSTTSLQQTPSNPSDQGQARSPLASIPKQSRGLEDTKSWKSRSRPKLDLTGSADSSDDSAVYHTSNVTTPLSSRPQSELEASRETLVNKTRQSKKARFSHINDSREAEDVERKVDQNDAREHLNSSNTKSAGPEIRLKVSNGLVQSSRLSTELRPDSTSLSEFTTEPTISTALQRHPSVSKSMSTLPLEDLSFLPPLKHQPLVIPAKAKGRANKSKQISTQDHSSTTNSSTSSLPTMNRSNSVVLRSNTGQVLQEARMQYPQPTKPLQIPTSPRNTAVSGRVSEPIAKMFVICCSCHYFHDLPSKIYECMASPDAMVRDKELGVSGIVSTTVKCPWCGHGMSTGCCAGWTGVVYLNERLH